MCGIVAFYSDRKPVSSSLLQQALATLEHRGPDGQRTWISPTQDAGLGHARLSIIDLQTGQQPLANEDEQVHAVVNGEFYDFERIRQDLERRGHRFRTRTDSEILVHLYEEYGAHCVQHLRGEYAFVLWDQRTRRMIAGRDRFGIKPLYYSTIDATTVFASEAKALFAAGHNAAWDADRFVQRLLTSWYAPDQTLFRDVRQVPPGHYMIVSAGESKLFRYWDFDFPAEGGDLVAGGNEEERIEHFRSVLDEAVRLRLRADVPVGCYLSGGLDSSAVIGLAARHLEQPIRAFSLSFSDAGYDEQAIARETAAHVNADFTMIPVTPEALADDFTEAVRYAEQPFVNSHCMAKFRLSRAVRDAGYRVVLTGEGADEILGGYPHFRRDMLLYNRQGQDPGAIANLLADLEKSNAISRGLLMPAGDTLPLRGPKNVLGFVPSWLETFAATGLMQRPFIAPDYLNDASADPFFGLLDTMDVRGQLNGRAPVHQSAYIWSKTVLPNYILTVLGDRMEMAHSVEGRVPFLDHHVVEAASRLPVSFKIRGMTEKYALREAARPYITDAVYRRQKHPFLAPPAVSDHGNPLQELIQTTLRGAAFRRIPFFDHGRIIALLDALPKMPVEQRLPLDSLFIALTSTGLLTEQFGVN
jgi:asparagine synthase (glutamine-hydrolysing)